MLDNEQLKEAFEKIRVQLMLPENDVKDLFQRVSDIEYWKTVGPGMSVLSLHSRDDLESMAISSDQEARALEYLASHGYFQLPPLIPSAVIVRMCTAVETLRSAGWPAIFSYVYDEFWAVPRTPSMVRFLSRHLGEGYLQRSAIWTYRVDPQQQASGWPPHVDGRGDAEPTNHLDSSFGRHHW